MAPVTESDLHAWVDGLLAPARHAQIDRFLADHPAELERVQHWQRQNGWLRGLLDPVLAEPLPLRLPLKPRDVAWPWRGIAAGLAIAVVSGAVAWSARGSIDAQRASLTADALIVASPGMAPPTLAAPDRLTGFAQRAAVAHVVYSPDQGRPVEVGADQQQALVRWLTKRMGTAVHPPCLDALGYELIGGRLLPGERQPVAQFMYGSAGGQRLTLYVTREVTGHDAAFRFGRDGPVNVFYWIDDHFGYAISAGADRNELFKVSQEVYRQLDDPTNKAAAKAASWPG